MSARKPDQCVVCYKLSENNDRFNPFIVAIVRGTRPHPLTGRPEPVVRDGIFDANGKLALLKACPSCGSKVKLCLEKRDPKVLPRGEFRTLMEQIAARQRLEDLKLH